MHVGNLPHQGFSSPRAPNFKRRTTAYLMGLRTLVRGAEELSLKLSSRRKPPMFGVPIEVVQWDI